MRTNNKKHIYLVSILLVLIYSNCTKELDREGKEYYFLMGVVINEQPPVFKLFRMNLSGSSPISYSDYELELRSSLGEYEKLSNGQFNTIIGKPGVSYHVKWKRKTENKWHEFKKQLPEYDEKLISDNIYETGNSYSINTSAINYGYYLGPNSNLTNNNSWDDLFQILTRGIGGKLLDLVSDNISVRLWPPALKQIESSNKVRYINNITCHKPFTWSSNQYEKYVLYQTHKKDFENNFQLQTNHVKSVEPLYVGNPIIFDYKKDINYGNLFTYNIYRDVKLENIIQIDGVLHFKIFQNNQPLDSSKFEITNVRTQTPNKHIVAFNYNTNLKTNGILGFQDYFDHHFSQTPCKLDQKYVLDFAVRYRNKITGVSEFYEDKKNYEYFGQSDTIIINLP